MVTDTHLFSEEGPHPFPKGDNRKIRGKMTNFRNILDQSHPIWHKGQVGDENSDLSK